jgi:hypothetical protein
MKTIDTDMMMAGLEDNIILVLIQQLQQALALQQQGMMMGAISISIKIVLRRALALAQQLVETEEVAQQVRVLVQPLVVDQQQVQAVPLQAEVI